MHQSKGRVAPIQPNEIHLKAVNFCALFGILGVKKNEIQFDKVFEKLSIYGVTVNVKSDKAWANLTFGLTDAHYDPSTATITVPQKTYNKACKGIRSALSIMLHEIGHLLLAHKALLHHSQAPLTEDEDAEQQADKFADFVLEIMGYNKRRGGVRQMSLNFDN